MLLSLLLIIFVVLWCEYLVYYVKLSKCSWPDDERAATGQWHNVMVLTDVHLIDKDYGSTFDRYRRDWQMYRSFQTAVAMFQPSTVLILGDLFDQGEWATSDEAFRVYHQRFEDIFRVAPTTKLYVLLGNHDVGFHYRLVQNEQHNARFEKAFNVSLVDTFQLGDGIHFVRVNSMALEGDGCRLCVKAMTRIERLGRYFEEKRSKSKKPVYPILLTHFPFYRPNEAVCNDEDAVPAPDNAVPNRMRVDVFTPEASNFLLERLKPRLVLNGHVHYSCVVNHTVARAENAKHVTEEVTVASFNMRNIYEPSFLLMQVSPDGHRIRRCYLPNELIIIYLYIYLVFNLILNAYLFFRCRYKHKMYHLVSGVSKQIFTPKLRSY